jgi:hypothetical protein
MEDKLEIEKKNSLIKFQLLKKTSTELAIQCEGLKVTDSTTEAIATNIISEAAAFSKTIDKTRKEMKAPYIKINKDIESAAKELTEGLNKNVQGAKDELLAYKQKVEAERQEELRKVEALKRKLENYKEDTEMAIDNAEDMDQLKAANVKWIKPMLNEDWGQFTSEAASMKKLLLNYGGLRMATIMNPESEAVKAEVVKAKVESEEAIEVVAVEEIVNLEVNTTSNVRKTWTHEVLDLTKVPLEWLMLNEAKVAAYRKEAVAKKEITEETITSGIRFYQKESISIR